MDPDNFILKPNPNYSQNTRLSSKGYQYLDRMSLPGSNHSTDPLQTDPLQTDPLQRLEVETTSTTSIPISFPYYYIDERTTSFDTFNLLHTGSDQQDPTYKNTTHIQDNSKKTKEEETDPNRATIGGLIVKKGDSSPESLTRLKEISNDAFNPVPKRFSQFITEQQQFSQRPPDELTSNTTSIGSDSDNMPINRPRKSFSTMSTRMKASGQSPSMSYAMRNSGGRKSSGFERERSNSIKSQATIFSTRQEEQKLYPSETQTSSLQRRRAIRSKQGGFFYRMKLRLKKLLKKFRINRFKRTASSKRTGNSIRNKSRTLRRKQRPNPKNPHLNKITISAPVNNPQLGKTKVTKVSTLDDELKYEAGAPRENVNVSKADNPRINHLSQYIDQQQGMYLNNMTKKANSINYGTSPAMHYRNKSLYDQIEEVPVSECSTSTPPPVPAHGVNQPNQTVLGTYEDLVQLWRNYLFYVVLKRIQLRQEISYFQQLLVGQELKSGKLSVRSSYSMYDIDESNEGSETEADGDIDDTDSQATVSESGTLSSTITDSTTKTEDQVVQYLPDQTTEKFNKRYNRQSVLGEMLDYDSDTSDSSTNTAHSLQSLNQSLNQSVVSNHSFNQQLQRQNSLNHSNLEIDKKYSIKQKKLTRSLSSVSSTNKANSPLRRSAGYQLGLNLVN